MGAILAGCDGGPVEPKAADVEPGSWIDQDAALPPDVVLPDPDADCGASSRLVVQSQTPLPGRGYRFLVRVLDDGGERRAGLARCLTVASESGRVQRSAAARLVVPAPGHLLVVVRSDFAERAASARALDAFLSTRPGDEQIAVLRWGTSIQQVVGFSPDRELLSRRIATMASVPSGGELPMPFNDAVRSAADIVLGVGGSGDLDGRAVVVLGGSDDEVEGLEESAVPVFVVRDGADPGEALLAISTRMERLRESAFYLIGACVEEEDKTVRIADRVDVELGPAAPESVGASCDPAMITAGEGPVSRQVELIFTDAERDVYQRVLEEKSREDFRASIRMAPDQEPVGAYLHLRGQSSIGCLRKSYTLDIDGDTPRTPFPGASTDELLLVSLCLDDRYVEQHFADLLMAELDLFPFGLGFVELTVDGESKGVYLLVEKPKEVVLRDQIGVRSLIRRRFDPEDKVPDVKYAHDDDLAVARVVYESMVESLFGLSGDRLAEAALARLDLDAYLRWMAFNTLFGVGDYVDEVWFFAVAAMGVDGGVVDEFRIAGWDADDLFSNCHHRGEFAIEDPHELLYCAEGKLDAMLFHDAEMYDRYVGTLEQLIERLDPVLAERVAGLTWRAISPFFEDPTICEAMVELLEKNPEASDPQVAQREIAVALEKLLDQLVERRQLLTERIAAYRRAVR